MHGLKNSIMIAVIGVLIIVVFLGIRKTQTGDVYVVTSESYFNTFEIIDGKVYIYTTIVFQNDSSEEKEIAIKGKFTEDQRRGLLEEEILEGYDKETSEKSFFIEAKATKEYNIIFEGKWGNKNPKNDRNLPEIEIAIL